MYSGEAEKRKYSTKMVITEFKKTDYTSYVYSSRCFDSLVKHR